MRKKRDYQLCLTPPLPEHSHLAELREISRILDENAELLDAVYSDLVRNVRGDCGATGMTAEQVLRAHILYQMKQWSFEELAFELRFHSAYREFCGLAFDQHPSKSALHRDFGRITAETLERINRRLMSYAYAIGVEDGMRARTDCTVVETTIHAPTDSSLLWDCVRELTRLMIAASDVVNVGYSDHRKRAKRRSFAIQNAKRMDKRLAPYRDLLKVTKKTLSYAKRFIGALKQSHNAAAPKYIFEFERAIGLTERVINQTERRVLAKESVPAHEKVVSIFEDHTDVIRKDGRETLYGHKICVTVGASNLVTDCVVLDGNPGDSTLTVDMVKRHQDIFDVVPEQVAFDGAFGSKDNLAQLKDLGVTDVAFSKAKWAKVTEMVKDSWVYQRLRHFRAGVEGVISFLKRAFGLSRCRWKGRAGFQRYCWGAILSANLLTLARHALA